MDEKKEIEKHDSLFKSPLELFKSTPYNETFTEVRTGEMHAFPKDPLSESYTFTRNGENIGVIKTSSARLSGNFQLKTPLGADSC